MRMLPVVTGFVVLAGVVLGSFAFLRTTGETRLRPADFLPPQVLEEELAAFCLKMPVSQEPAQTDVLWTSTTVSDSLRLETIDFRMGKKGVEGGSQCGAMRDMVRVVDPRQGLKTVLFDSQFYPEAYCEDPVRILHAPLVFAMTDLTEASGRTRKLAVLESSSTTLPCPDTEENKSRHFLFFDLDGGAKLLLDVQADFIAPENGNLRPYRINLTGVSRVVPVAGEGKKGHLPSSVELVDGAFVVRWSGSSVAAPSDSRRDAGSAGRAQLNSIYSKDEKQVYIETVDVSGPIRGADPKTFRLLDDRGESPYAKDDKNVYFYGKKVPAADAKTFVQMNDRYGKDLHHVFFMESALAGVDVASFATPYRSVWYARDKDHVFSGDHVFAEADPASFSTGEDRSCGPRCTYRNDDKDHRFDHNDRIVQKVAP